MSAATLKYNGYTFPDNRQTSLRCRTLYDSAGRGVKGLEYTLTITWVITKEDAGGSSMSTYLSDVRNKLMEPRKDLTGLDALGFPVENTAGGTTISGSSDSGDIEFGPKPISFDVTVLVEGQAFQVQWTCVFVLKHCPHEWSVEEYVWGVSYQVDQNGLTTRTIDGKIILKGQLDSFQVVPGIRVSVDRSIYLGVVIPPPIPGYQRTIKRTISEDKRELDFTVVDKPIDSPNAYPPGIEHCDVNFTVESSLKGDGLAVGFANWLCTLSGTFRVLPGYSKSFAISAFNLILNAYQARANNARAPSGSTRAGIRIPLLHYRISDKPYEREIEIEASWLLTTSINTMLAASGIGITLPPRSWEEWHKSRLKHHSLFGYDSFQYSANYDAVLTLCDPAGTIPPTSPGKYPSINLRPRIKAGCPPKNRSYLYMRYNIKEEYRSRSKRHYPSYGYRNEDRPNGTPPRVRVVYQGRPEKGTWIILRYWIARVCYKPNLPHLVRYKGRKVREYYYHYEITSRRYGNKRVYYIVVVAKYRLEEAVDLDDFDDFPVFEWSKIKKNEDND